MTMHTLDILAGRLPADQPSGRTPLERQVRLLAGASVLAGTMLGLHVHPAFHLLPVLVGIGLLWAGITESCGLGLLLARSAVESRTGRGTSAST